MRPKFNENEFKVIGQYQSYPTHRIPGHPPLPPQPIFNTPITPKENWKLLFNGQKPYWIPQAGWFFCDVHIFRPRMHPDNYATRLIIDGEDSIDYESNIIKAWFDLDWEWSDIAGGATVHPGNPAVPDINRWEEYVPFPNLDDMDWEDCIEKNKEYVITDKMLQAGSLSGFWERLMSLMDVDNAAIAMIDEDQHEGIHRLFDRLANLYVDYIDRLHTNFGIDSFLMHDDWGHQHAPFFSLQTCREMIVPYLKRVTDACHERGIAFELHSCGKNEILVPAMIEAGVDLWCGQEMNDYQMLTTKYKDSSLVFGIIAPFAIPQGRTEEEVRQLAREFVDKYKDCKIAIVDLGSDPGFLSAVYEYSRKAYEDESEIVNV